MSTQHMNSDSVHNSRDDTHVGSDLKQHLPIFLPLLLVAFGMFCIFPISITMYRRYTRKSDTLTQPLVQVKVELPRHGRVMQTAAMGYMHADNEKSLNTQQRHIMNRLEAGIPHNEITNTSRRPSFSISHSVSKSTTSQMEYEDELFGDSEVIGLEIRPISTPTW